MKIRLVKLKAVISGAFLVFFFSYCPAQIGAKSTTGDVYDLIKLRQSRADTIAGLKSYARSSNIKVTLVAAEFLLALGDKEGAEICNSILRGDEYDSGLKIRCATRLEQYGILMPFDILSRLYDKTADPAVIQIMAMQGHPQATDLILKLHASGEAGGSYFFLAYTDVNGAGFNRASIDISHAQRTEFTELAIYHAATKRDNRYLGEVISLIEREDLSTDNRSKDGRYDNEAFRLLINIKSEEVRDYLRRGIEKMGPDSASYALASLYAVQKDYVFVDALIDAELAKRRPKTFHGRLFWRIAAKRSVQNKYIADLVEKQASPEVKQAYFGLDAAFIDSYWIGEYISYRPLAHR